MSLTFNQLSHRYDNQQVLVDVNLGVCTGEILAILGPSGSGKTTLLRLAAGLEILQTGQIIFNDTLIANEKFHTPPEERSSAVVFQDHILFPHLTVQENVAFGRSENASSSIVDLLTSVGIENLSSRYPDTLSGGQQQRVAIARAIATEPNVLLLDEPFSNVDLALRRQLREDARLMFKAKNITAVLVTHDPIEAMYFGDRVACLVDGQIVQFGTPHELWSEPRHPFVATTITNAQLINGVASKGEVITEFGKILGIDKNYQGSVVIGLLPEGVRLESKTDHGNLKVEDIRFSAGNYDVVVGSANSRLNVTAHFEPDVSIGDYVNLSFTRERIRVYPK